jgi:hypothetical protein
VALRSLPDPGQLRVIAADLAEVAELTLGNTGRIQLVVATPRFRGGV